VSLREPIRSFWQAWGGLNPLCVETTWGQVVTDARFPRVWEANRAAVLRRHARTSASAIRGRLLPALRDANATHETVEFWDPPTSCPALEELRAGAAEVGIDVLMVFRGDPDALRETERRVDVREIARPGRSFWTVYRDSRIEFGGDMSRETLGQLVQRDREVLVPAGLRWFVGHADGRPAGYASLISLEGVGYLDNVVTVPELRRRGVAAACVAAAVRTGTEAGDRLVFLLAERDGNPQRLYERMGFRTVAPVESFTTPLGSEVRS